MLRKKRYPITRAGTELTPEAVEKIVKEIEDADPADFRRRPFDGSSLRQSRISRIDMHLRDFGDAVRWKAEDGVKAVREVARKATHRHAKV